MGLRITQGFAVKIVMTILAFMLKKEVHNLINKKEE